MPGRWDCSTTMTANTTEARPRGPNQAEPLSRVEGGDSVVEARDDADEPFQRGSRRIRTDHAGVGLGLAIVKSIAHAHDGTLTLTPRAAGGLCVTVRLPAAPSQGPRPKDP